MIEVDAISSRTQRLLDQADALVEDAQWADAVETLTLVLQESENQLVRASPTRFVPLAESCQARLAQLPDEALTGYRARIDPSAAQLLEEARASQDPAPLRRIVEECFVSRHTPDALLLVADLAMERGDYDAARRALQRLDPLLTDPAGRPIGLALRGIDLDQHWPAVLEELQKPREFLPAFCPNGREILPHALARLALISLHEHDQQRAALEVEVLRRLEPSAIGRLAGRDAPLAETLGALLEEAQSWATDRSPSAAGAFNAGVDRSGVAAPLDDLAGPIWPRPYNLSPVQPPTPQPQRVVRVLANGGRIITTVATPPEPVPFAQSYPCVYGPWVLLRDGPKLVSLNLFSGEPAIVKNGVLEEGTPAFVDPRINLQLRGGIQVWGGFAGGRQRRLTGGAPEGPLEVADGVLFARVAPRKKPTRRTLQAGGPDYEVVGFDLLSDGLEVVDFQQPAEPWKFSGPPIVRDGLAYVVLDADEVRPRLAVGCYSIDTGEQLWQTAVCSGPPPGDYEEGRSADVLSMSGDRLYLNTNFGAVAAVDAADGRLCWVTEYPRNMDQAPQLQPTWSGVAPCVAYRGRVIAAPLDCSLTFALDAATGCLLWSTDLGEVDATLLGAHHGVVVSGGDRLSGIDADTGALRYLWPESDRAGIRGMGRGCLAGDEVFWPTRDRIYVMNLATGAPSRPAVPLGPLAGAGANLAAGHGLLVAAGKDKLTVFGANPATPTSDPPASAQADAQKPTLAELTKEYFGRELTRTEALLEIRRRASRSTTNPIPPELLQALIAKPQNAP